MGHPVHEVTLIQDASIDNIQQIADTVQKGLLLIVRASFQQGRARLTRLRNELCTFSATPRLVRPPYTRIIRPY